METFCSVARWDGDRLTVWDSTQGVFDRQQEIARFLDLPLSQVRVVSHYMGGGFGSKLSTGKYTIIAALMARRTGRPVKVALPREDTFRCVGNRPAQVITVKGGVKRDGTLVGLDLTNLGEAGAYEYHAWVGSLLFYLYTCPNVRRTETTALINAGPARAMRAPGYPQGAWALEQVVDALAEKIGMDPVELRLRNIPAGVQGRDIAYTSTGLAECLRRGAEAFGWAEARGRTKGDGPWRRGVGAAAGMWGYPGEDNAGAVVKLFADGTASLTMGASDIGTGTKTVMAMVVSEELGIPPERIFIEHADTGTTPYSPGSGGSQTVVANAPAVRAAAAQLKERLLEMAAEQLELPAEQLSLADGKVVPDGQPEKAVALAALEGLQRARTLLAIGRRHPHPAGKISLPFAAQFAEVEVNVDTGEIRVLRMVAAHDSGRVMSRLTYRNQVFGGITMGIGFGLTEERVLDRHTGKMLNANWHDYKIPTMLDVAPAMDCVPVDPHDTECNTTGAKGLGEPATIPTAAAIANAVYHATGIRVTHSPVTPARMVTLLARTRKEG
jgi:CO/xanthine dehydrogenase Mo-binding subunit